MKQSPQDIYEYGITQNRVLNVSESYIGLLKLILCIAIIAFITFVRSSDRVIVKDIEGQVYIKTATSDFIRVEEEVSLITSFVIMTKEGSATVVLDNNKVQKITPYSQTQITLEGVSMLTSQK